MTPANMKLGKKLHLVTEEENNKLLSMSDNKSSSIPPATENFDENSIAENLDREMQSIVNDRSMNISDKVSMYNQCLARLQENQKKDISLPGSNLAEKKPDERSRTVQSLPSSTSSTVPIKTASTKTLINNLPKDLRRKAGAVLKQWSKRANIGVNDKGELVIDGGAIRGGNAVALFTKLAAADNRDHPFGWDDMIQEVAKLKLPIDLQSTETKARNKPAKRLYRKPKTKMNKTAHNSRLAHTLSTDTILSAPGWISFS